MQTPRPSATSRWWFATLFFLLAVIYLPGLGHGFIKDDFAWIRTSRLSSVADLAAVLTSNVGFYRPAVSLSFGLNEALFGLQPLGYGLTNFALLLGGCLALAALGRALGLTRLEGFLAAGLWSLNFHGINMAVLWTSGRTSLMVSLFAFLAARYFVQARPIAAAAWFAAAVFSKEEAVVLPFALAVFAMWCQAPCESLHKVPGTVVRRLVPLLLILAAYLAAREASGAFWPHDAPPFYRPTTSLGLLARNVGEYLDRAVTFSLAASVVAMLVARVRPRIDVHVDRRVLIFGVLWAIGGYAITVFGPVRSSLYAVLPSAGVAIVAGQVLGRLVASNRGRRLVTAGLVLIVLLVPVYWRRNARWVRLADLSARVLADLKLETAGLPPGATLRLEDDPSQRANLDAAFGSLLPDAVVLFVRPDLQVTLARDVPAQLTLKLRQGRLERVSP